MGYLEERAHAHEKLFTNSEISAVDTYRALVILFWACTAETLNPALPHPFQQFAHFTDEELQTDDLIQEAMAEADAFLTGKPKSWARPPRYKTFRKPAL